MPLAPGPGNADGSEKHTWWWWILVVIAAITGKSVYDLEKKKRNATDDKEQ